MNVKVVFKSNTIQVTYRKRRKIDCEKVIDYEQFCEWVRECKNDNDERLVSNISYKDEEGDDIQISNQTDFEMWLDCNGGGSEEKKMSTLLIKLEKNVHSSHKTVKKTRPQIGITTARSNRQDPIKICIKITGFFGAVWKCRLIVVEEDRITKKRYFVVHKPPPEKTKLYGHAIGEICFPKQRIKNMTLKTLSNNSRGLIKFEISSFHDKSYKRLRWKCTCKGTMRTFRTIQRKVVASGSDEKFKKHNRKEPNFKIRRTRRQLDKNNRTALDMISTSTETTLTSSETTTTSSETTSLENVVRLDQRLLRF